jgi:hypothetical protein
MGRFLSGFIYLQGGGAPGAPRSGTRAKVRGPPFLFARGRRFIARFQHAEPICRSFAQQHRSKKIALDHRGSALPCATPPKEQDSQLEELWQRAEVGLRRRRQGFRRCPEGSNPSTNPRSLPARKKRRHDLCVGDSMFAKICGLWDRSHIDARSH